MLSNYLLERPLSPDLVYLIDTMHGVQVNIGSPDGIPRRRPPHFGRMDAAKVLGRISSSMQRTQVTLRVHQRFDVTKHISLLQTYWYGCRRTIQSPTTNDKSEELLVFRHSAGFNRDQQRWLRFISHLISTRQAGRLEWSSFTVDEMWTQQQ